MRYILGVTLVFVLGGLLFFMGCGESSDTPSSQSNPSSESNTSFESNLTTQAEPSLRGIIPMSVDFSVQLAKNNEAAYVSSQCYTKTQDEMGGVHNPCFSCHTNSIAPNYVDDAALQAAYDFSAYTSQNRFTNLFKDRTALVAEVSDVEIIQYVKRDNYKTPDGKITLAQKLKNVPKEWDVNGNGVWDGYVPDCHFDFDSEGFDRDPNGEYTLWRAFRYYPFLGTFWPTNGSTDDVLIRLPREFAQNEDGSFDLETYKLNLAIVESLIKQKNVTINGVDERKYGIDLNRDGSLGETREVKFIWEKPDYNMTTKKLENFTMSYVGRAKEMLLTNEHLIAPGLYPKGVEFLHTVRYMDVDINGTISMAPHMKELRYGKKTAWNNYGQLFNAADAEAKEKAAFPDRLRNVGGDSEHGMQSGTGWTYQGFIEDAQGELRAQNFEESLFCMGCHGGIGATTDTTFAFSRKFDANETLQTWYHWSQKADAFKNIPEPKRRDGKGEYTLYLEQNSAGDEFRANSEVMEKFFDEEGKIKQEELAKVKEDISHLIIPSAKRALELNKAYKIIVEEQSFIYGRDPHTAPLTNVHKKVEPGTTTGNEIILN